MENYITSGTCSKSISFEVKDGKVYNVRFVRGCAGNTQGVSRLAEGRDIDELISTLSGIQCRNGTSCPDQLARALAEYKKNHEN